MICLNVRIPHFPDATPTTLNLDNNQISDLTSLKGLTNLTNLYLTNNRISNISPLNNLTHLNQVTLQGQTVVLPSIKSKGNIAELENPLRDNLGQPVNSLNDISNGGKYNTGTNKVEWDNITNDLNESYYFNQNVNIGGTSAQFSGIVTTKVIYSESPVISGVINISIKEGTKFDPMAGVTATDKEDGDITKNVKISGTVDVNKPGEYELTYSVTDKDGNKATEKRVITVNPKMVAINAIPQIKAEDKTIKEGTKFDPMDGVTATDKEDGDITKDIKVIKNTVDTSKPGKYEVTYEVTDSNGGKSTKTVEITVRSNEAPVISGVENESIKEGTKFDPMAGVTAKDKEDGDITKDIKVSGTVDTNKPGDYELTYSVTDKDGTKFDPMDGVTATDKEDGDITKDIKVIKNTVDTSKPGKYEVTYAVTDSNGETTTKTIFVSVIGDNSSNDTIASNKPSNTQENNQSNQQSTNNNYQSNPQTGDTGVIGYLGLGLAAILGVFINRKK